jgi:hypothetical protein
MRAVVNTDTQTIHEFSAEPTSYSGEQESGKFQHQRSGRRFIRRSWIPISNQTAPKKKQ